MGLDMYLYKEKYFSDFRGDVPKIEGFEGCDSLFVRGEAVYWRKANAIHNWFVEKVQGGIDECQLAYVEVDALRELGEVESVLENKENAPEILPTQSGFFFGSTNYDEYYFRDLEHTRDKLKELLGAPDVEEYDYYYRSSW